jgi:hypothetical protein
MIITLDAFVNPHDRISVTPTHENVGAHFTCARNERGLIRLGG